MNRNIYPNKAVFTLRLMLTPRLILALVLLCLSALISPIWAQTAGITEQISAQPAVDSSSGSGIRAVLRYNLGISGLGQLSADTVIMVFSRRGPWYQARHQGREFEIHASNLKLLGPSAAVPEISSEISSGSAAEAAADSTTAITTSTATVNLQPLRISELPPSSSPSSSSSSSGGVTNSTESAAASTTAAATTTPTTITGTSSASGTVITSGSRVLHIGDSHTVGIYGQEMDRLLRASGAQVETYASSGSSPVWWKNGQITRSGFYSKDADGRVIRPANWNDPHPTPKLADLISRFRPTVVIVSLGANLINSSAAVIQRQTSEMAQQIKDSGAELIWVGPPNGRESKKSTESQTRLYQSLKPAAERYGRFIDSRPYTSYPASGGDGVHYSGTAGGQIARDWAKQVMAEVRWP